MIRVGATGHRDLAGFDTADLENEIRNTLEKLKQGHKEYVMLSSIAAGADQLCAEIGLELGYKLICPLPFAEYRYDFNGEDQKSYDFFLGKAADSFIVADGPDKNEAYLAAGRYIAENCDVLLAVWDKKPQQSICGTQAVVKYAKSLRKEVKILNNE